MSDILIKTEVIVDGVTYRVGLNTTQSQVEKHLTILGDMILHTLNVKKAH